MTVRENYTAVGPIIDDLCHALGVVKKDVMRIDITPGLVDALVRDANGHAHVIRYSWPLTS